MLMLYTCHSCLSGLVTFSIMIGFGIQASGNKAKPLADLFDALYTIVFKIMDVIILW